MSTIIAPSLLSADFGQLKNEIVELNKFSNLWFHLDIMDGHFVPNLTYGHPVIKTIEQYAKHPLDAHLMVENPLFYLESFKEFNVHNLTFHWETLTHHDRTLKYAKEHYSSVGVALNPSTPLSVIPDYIYEFVDVLLIMGVNPGFSGQKFIPNTLDKVKQAHKIKNQFGHHFAIQVDGGVSEKTASSLISSGASNLVTGSYLFQASDKNSALEKLR